MEKHHVQFFFVDSVNKLDCFTYFSDDGNTALRLDYVFFSKQLGECIDYAQKRVFFSDHVCVVVCLKFNGVAYECEYVAE